MSAPLTRYGGRIVAGDRQTLDSQYGRESLTVSALVPTVMLRHHLGRTHVGTSPLEVALDVARAVKRQRAKGVTAWSREMRRETYAAALWLHAENRAEYGYVMGGGFGV